MGSRISLAERSLIHATASTSPGWTWPANAWNVSANMRRVSTRALLAERSARTRVTLAGDGGLAASPLLRHPPRAETASSHESVHRELTFRSRPRDASSPYTRHPTP